MMAAKEHRQRDDVSVNKWYAQIPTYRIHTVAGVKYSDVEAILKFRSLTSNGFEYGAFSAMNVYYEKLWDKSPDVCYLPTSTYREWNATGSKWTAQRNVTSPLLYPIIILPIVYTLAHEKGSLTPAMDLWLIAIFVNITAIRRADDDPPKNLLPSIIVIDSDRTPEGARKRKPELDKSLVKFAEDVVGSCSLSGRKLLKGRIYYPAVCRRRTTCLLVY